MAEKRIVLTVDDGYCETECVYFPIACSDECEHLDKPTFSYTSQEAIERMAKALIRADYPSGPKSVWQRRWEYPDSNLYYLTIAEAALNAIAPMIPQEDNNER